ncbi:MAG: hypothetical protein OES19_07140 [Nitrosopumilus sp.]|nr:hypothetical protein [Nitrosopumilus sp.]MDH3834324.1 hypothetical protein [Nitrosopumilus sp.]
MNLSFKIKKFLINKFKTQQNLKIFTTVRFVILAAVFSALPDVIPKQILEGNSSETTLNPIVLVFYFM